ncbi:hypothetical protein [Halorussus caseinilyticus]|uniref:Uncharacterized protein n=1 Tax=Halorussus caseinilyticus TaxID=3034025 RepID=A0ABD5WMS2_9EURY
MPHEENVTYAVRGRVFDVRGHELALALSLNGANRTLNLSVNTTPGAIGTFETNVTLSRQVNRITVAATDPNRRWSPEYGGDNRTVGRDVLRLDGDGLPDFYELNVTGTDPLGPDSNASRTSFNESGNNVTDGAEDFDNDGETAAQAYWFDLDPLDNDTDGDRLRDGFELQFSGIDPLSPDTDNDTVRDSAEDLDNDSLSNRREQTAGTNPVENDTDSDTLGDAEELANGTDPLSPDTDSDGLTDPNEYELGTDPTVADTDGDGVLTATKRSRRRPKTSPSARASTSPPTAPLPRPSPSRTRPTTGFRPERSPTPPHRKCWTWTRTPSSRRRISPSTTTSKRSATSRT